MFRTPSSFAPPRSLSGLPAWTFLLSSLLAVGTVACRDAWHDEGANDVDVVLDAAPDWSDAEVGGPDALRDLPAAEDLADDAVPYTDGPDTITDADATTREPLVYVTVHSHNEEGTYWEGLVTDETAYLAYRADLVAKVKLLASRGVPLDWQSDHSVLQAMAAHEQGAPLSETGGKNVLRWMVEDMRMSVDPHGHLTQYNMADISSLIAELGVTPSGVVGGFAEITCGTTPGTVAYGDWKAVLEIGTEGTIHGRKFPEAVWTPRVLTQAAMVGHTMDEFSSGVWRPGDGANFPVHTPAEALVYVGQGYPHDTLNIGPTNSGGATIHSTAGAYVKELVARIESGELPSGAMHTASIHLRDQPSLPGVPSTLAGLEATLDALQDLATSGRIAYVTYEQAEEIWTTRFNSVPNRVPLDGFSFYKDVLADLANACETTATGCTPDPCPNGTVCAPAPVSKCVKDCRVQGNMCPVQLPQCDLGTGLCGAAGSGTSTSSIQFDVVNPASGATLWAKAFYPADAGPARRYPAVVTVPGGAAAGSVLEIDPNPNKNPAVQAGKGFVVVIFDPDGRGNSGGIEDDDGFIHQDGLAALIEATAALDVVDPTRLGVFTGSYGITMGSGCLARHPELPVRFLLDFEGPADRNDTGHCDASDTGHLSHDCADDTWWNEREAVRFIGQTGVPYLRIQNAVDHAQPDNLHCIAMVNAATDVSHGGTGACPWTRVNTAAQNVVNAVYTPASPPAYNAAGTVIDLSGFWTELLALPMAKALPTTTRIHTR